MQNQVDNTKIEELIHNLSTPENYKKHIKPYRQACNKGDVPTMELVISSVSQVIKVNNEHQPMTQLNGIRLIKETLDKNNQKMRELVMEVILPQMTEIAQYQKQNKSDDRGKTYFNNGNNSDLQVLGNSFFRLILECLLVWGFWFPNTQFSKDIAFLKNQGVTFPQSLNYFKGTNLQQLEEEANQILQSQQNQQLQEQENQQQRMIQEQQEQEAREQQQQAEIQRQKQLQQEEEERRRIREEEQRLQQEEQELLRQEQEQQRIMQEQERLKQQQQQQQKQELVTPQSGEDNSQQVVQNYVQQNMKALNIDPNNNNNNYQFNNKPPNSQRSVDVRNAKNFNDLIGGEQEGKVELKSSTNFRQLSPTNSLYSLSSSKRSTTNKVYYSVNQSQSGYPKSQSGYGGGGYTIPNTPGNTSQNFNLNNSRSPPSQASKYNLGSNHNINFNSHNNGNNNNMNGKPINISDQVNYGEEIQKLNQQIEEISQDRDYWKAMYEQDSTNLKVLQQQYDQLKKEHSELEQDHMYLQQQASKNDY